MVGDFPHGRRVLTAFAFVSLVSSLAEAGAIALIAAVALAVSTDTGVVLDFGAIDAGTVTVGSALWAAAAAVALITVTRVLGAYLAARLSTIGIVHTRLSVLGAYLRTSWEAQEGERLGHIHELASMHAVRMSQTLHLLSGLVMSAVGLGVLTVGAAVAAPVAAAFMIVLTGSLALALRPVVRKTRSESAEHLVEHNRVLAAVEEATGVTAEVRVFGVTAQMHDRVRETVVAVTRSHLRTRFLALVVPGLMVSATLGALVAGLRALDAISIGEPLGLGVAILFLLRNMRAAQGAQGATQFIAEQWPYLQELREAGERFRSATPTRTGKQHIDEISSIELRGVEYRYPSGTRALRGIDLDIAAGDVVGIVGPSGGGKTTLVQVLLGLRRPTAGSLKVSGRELTEISEEDWHSLIAYVGQQPRLIAGSVRDNVRFLRPGVTDDDIERALDDAALSREVADWDAASSRQVGEGGRELSGGQRQRIALARAFAGRPHLVVLDEPTSALDVTSERRIQSAIQRLPSHVIVVLVAHRPSTLTVCDRILVMEQGCLREVPPPADEAAATVLLAAVTSRDTDPALGR